MPIMMLIKTTGIHYDDRVRKELRTLKELGTSAMLIAVEDANIRGTGCTNDGIRYRTVRILSRDLLPQARFLIFKTSEMYYRFLFQVIKHRPRILWLHDFQLSGFIFITWILKKVRLVRYVE